MGFWSLFEVASMPILQVLLISILGAFMATEYLNLLPADARKSLNKCKIVFMVFTPSLMFANLAQTVTLQDIISWWFMPINIGLTFFFGGILGWMVVKILRPKPHLEGLIIATCSSGNLGNLLLIIVPAICNEEGSPFGERSVCRSVGLSYASFSMAVMQPNYFSVLTYTHLCFTQLRRAVCSFYAEVLIPVCIGWLLQLGGFFIWTYTYQLVRTSSMKFKALEASEKVSKTPNNDLDADGETHLLKGDDQEHLAITVSSIKSVDDSQNEIIVDQGSANSVEKGDVSLWNKLIGLLHQILEELLAPPTLGAIVGLIFGAISWLKNLVVGDNAPLRVFQDSIQLLGDGTIPCITLILGGNLTQGLRSSKVKLSIIVGVVFVRYVLLPVIGIGVFKAATKLGFLPPDPLYHFVLMVQFTLPPAMNIVYEN
ncbi:hypothetical protein CJ030_MR8G005374 [Morella rubra]|uniref:Transporter C5D6.04 n=1 Tax=Morella rubra TaxID=262757 RepID=A0A6A1UNW7_9ROSI|nr:hypothetical protein CJ030_MR8G005374 [Morella rubra]